MLASFKISFEIQKSLLQPADTAETGKTKFYFSGTKDVFNLVTKMHSQSGITNVADVYNLSKYNSRIMAAFLPEYENISL